MFDFTQQSIGDICCLFWYCPPWLLDSGNPCRNDGVPQTFVYNDNDEYSAWERRKLAGETDLIPYAAPSTGAFGGNSPLGVRQGCPTLTKGQEPIRIKLRNKSQNLLISTLQLRSKP
jgi:hypothetical protein